MKKLLLTTALIGMSFPAMAEVPLYLSLGAGITHANDSDWDSAGLSGTIDIDNAANFSLAFGGGVARNVRTEVELAYRNANLSEISIDGGGSASLDGELKTWTLLVNGYYDFMEGQKFRPYLSAGLGAARHEGDISAVGGIGTPGADGSDTVFAYQVGAGAGYALTDKTSLWGGYRYLGTSDPDFDGLSAEYHAHEFRAGVKFSF